MLCIGLISHFHDYVCLCTCAEQAVVKFICEWLPYVLGGLTTSPEAMLRMALIIHSADHLLLFSSAEQAGVKFINEWLP